jgi:uridine kinase
MSQPIIIGVSGSSASGKTSLCKLLASQFDNDIPIITTDWFYKDLPEGADPETWDWDEPNHFDVDDIVRVLKDIKRCSILDGSMTVMAPGHDYTKYSRVENANSISVKEVVIIEGIFVLHEPKIREHLDLMIFVECDMDVVLMRRIKRDTTERGYKLNIVLDRYFQYAKPAYQKYIEPSKKHADLILMNNGIDGISKNKGIKVIKDHILSYQLESNNKI